MVSFNAVAQLAFLRSNPAWSIIIMAIDGLIIYGLTTGHDFDADAPPEHWEPSESSTAAQTHSRLA